MREPKTSAAQDTQLLFGHRFKCDKIEKKWAYGRALSPLGQEVDGYTGWVRRKALTENASKPSHYIEALKAPVFHAANIKSRVLKILCLGAQVSASAVDDKFFELASGGFVHTHHITQLDHYNESDFVTIAEAHRGLPYIWGGISTDGLDCSGLVQSSLRAVGRDCMRDAGQQEESLGKALNDGEKLRRGDLIFWPGHVGIMLDALTLLHANAHHMCVAEEPLSGAISRIGAVRTIRRLA